MLVLAHPGHGGSMVAGSAATLVAIALIVVAVVAAAALWSRSRRTK